MGRGRVRGPLWRAVLLYAIKVLSSLHTPAEGSTIARIAEHMRVRLPLNGAALILAINAPDVLAQQEHRRGFGFSGSLGWSTIGGDFGELLTSGIPAEGSIWYQPSWWRFGVSIHAASYSAVQPFQDQTISQMEFQLFGTFLFLRGNLVQPYAQVRAGATRWRPEGPLFDPNPPPPDVPPGENPAPGENGFQGGLALGAEFWVTKNFGLDVAGLFSAFSTEEFDVPILGITGLSSGTELGFRAGFVWFP